MSELSSKTDKAEEGGQRLVLPLIMSAAVLVALALSLIWLNIERTKLALGSVKVQDQLTKAKDLHSKLQVERDHLLSAAELGKRAEAMGLRAAKPGQIRRMTLPSAPAQTPEQP